MPGSICDLSWALVTLQGAGRNGTVGAALKVGIHGVHTLDDAVGPAESRHPLVSTSVEDNALELFLGQSA
jgi:hypothetical protein